MSLPAAPHVTVTGLIPILISGLMQHIVPDGRGSLPRPLSA
jgi:hypothetical protein